MSSTYCFYGDLMGIECVFHDISQNGQGNCQHGHLFLSASAEDLLESVCETSPHNRFHR